MSQGITLSKGQGISLSKVSASPLNKVVFGLGWDAFVLVDEVAGGFIGFGSKPTGKQVKEARNVDLDASCVTADEFGNILDVIYFGNRNNRNDPIFHTGDNLTGDGDGDDEQIIVHLNDLPEAVKSITFTVNAFSAVDFSIVQSAQCRLLDQNEKELLKYPLESAGKHTAIIMAILVKGDNGWEFKTVGEVCNGRTVNEIKNSVLSVISRGI
jgi:tellurium resistance protein TerZ